MLRLQCLLVAFASLTLAQEARTYMRHNMPPVKDAPLLVSDECEFGCVDGRELSRCGGKDECEDFLRRTRQADYLGYVMVSIFILMVFCLGCVLYDGNHPAM